jgi:hypothetical protein
MERVLVNHNLLDNSSRAVLVYQIEKSKQIWNGVRQILAVCPEPARVFWSF